MTHTWSRKLLARAGLASALANRIRSWLKQLPGCRRAGILALRPVPNPQGSGRGRVVFSSSREPTRAPRDPSNDPKPIFAPALKALAEGVFSVFFPSDCRLCGTPLTNLSRLPVCPSCRDSIRGTQGALCLICGERLEAAAGADGRCGLCRRIQPPFTRAAAYGSYDAGLREMIHLLKYERVRPAAEVLGIMLAEPIARLAPEFGAALPLVIPVPLHARKQRERGFNQSELIARAAVKRKPAGLMLEIGSGVLERRRATDSQTGLTRHQRRDNMRGAFAVLDPGRIAGRDALLVDDVFTTGTTVSECARVLLRAGAGRVWVATAARVYKSEPVLMEAPEQPAEQAPPAMAVSA